VCQHSFIKPYPSLALLSHPGLMSGLQQPKSGPLS
jgi:hypothetical protein